jgi:hypothetical protein
LPKNLFSGKLTLIFDQIDAALERAYNCLDVLEREISRLENRITPENLF